MIMHSTHPRYGAIAQFIKHTWLTAWLQPIELPLRSIITLDMATASVESKHTGTGSEIAENLSLHLHLNLNLHVNSRYKLTRIPDSK